MMSFASDQHESFYVPFKCWVSNEYSFDVLREVRQASFATLARIFFFCASKKALPSAKPRLKEVRSWKAAISDNNVGTHAKFNPPTFTKLKAVRILSSA